MIVACTLYVLPVSIPFSSNSSSSEIICFFFLIFLQYVPLHQSQENFVVLRHIKIWLHLATTSILIYSDQLIQLMLMPSQLPTISPTTSLNLLVERMKDQFIRHHQRFWRSLDVSVNALVIAFEWLENPSEKHFKVWDAGEYITALILGLLSAR